MSTWWGNDPTYEQRSTAAWSFLTDGNFYTPIGGTSCNDSFKCATGFSCVNGTCVSNTTLNENGGQCDGDNPYGGGKQTCYREQPSSGCITGTCGSTYEADCCGERCCRFDAYGTIRCFCGKCPNIGGQRCGYEYAAILFNYDPVPEEDLIVRDYGECDFGLGCVYENPDGVGADKGIGTCQELKPCIDYCDEYYKTNGQLAGGCSRTWVCDECQECTGEAENIGGTFNYCRNLPSGEAPPCWCDGSKREECTPYCNNDGTYSDFYPKNCAFCCDYTDYCGDTGRIISKRYCEYGYNDRTSNAVSTRCNIAKSLFTKECEDYKKYLEDKEKFSDKDCYESCVDSVIPGAGPCNFVGPAAGAGIKRTVTGCLENPGGGVTFFVRDCQLVGDGCYKKDPTNPVNNITTAECDCNAACGDAGYSCNSGSCEQN